jgi:hypothetical protein
MRTIRYPDASDIKRRRLDDIFPQRFVTFLSSSGWVGAGKKMHLSRYLWKSKSVRGDDCDRPGFGIEIIQWPVFFYGESKRCMVISDSVGILSDVLARDRVLSNGENGGSHYLR